MEIMKYFSDGPRGSVTISRVRPLANEVVAATFPGVRAVRFDDFSRLVGEDANGAIRPVTRVIGYKSRPSLHKCGAKCLGGSARGVCECSCGGANHGAGVAQ